MIEVIDFLLNGIVGVMVLAAFYFHCRAMVYGSLISWAIGEQDRYASRSYFSILFNRCSLSPLSAERRAKMIQSHKMSLLLLGGIFCAALLRGLAELLLK